MKTYCISNPVSEIDRKPDFNFKKNQLWLKFQQGRLLPK